MSGGPTRSRGRKRNQRKRRAPRQRRIKAATPTPGESQRSANYRAGRTVKYAWRIAGPTFPVHTIQEANTTT